MNVSRRVVRIDFESVDIPEGYVKCPTCNGSGEVRFRWSEPSFTNNPATSDFMSCATCLGDGYVTKDVADRISRFRIQGKETPK